MQGNCSRQSNPLDTLLAGVMQGLEGLDPQYWPGYEQESPRERRAQSVDPRNRGQQQGACRDPRSQKGNCKDYRRGYSWIEDAMPWAWWNPWGFDDEEDKEDRKTSCQGRPGCSAPGNCPMGWGQARPQV